MNPNFQSSVRGAGPWHLENPTARQMQALSTIYLPDVTVSVQNENIKCHSNVLSFASPVLAEMLRENEPHVQHPNQQQLRQLRIQLNNMLPIHFRIILEIVYSGDVTENLSVDLALQVGQIANDLQVVPVVLFCAARLRELANIDDACRIYDFAISISDNELKGACIQVCFDKLEMRTLLSVFKFSRHANQIRLEEACLKYSSDNCSVETVCSILDLLAEVCDTCLEERCIEIICENTDLVLETRGFHECKLSTLTTILSQEFLNHVTEGEIFSACVRWTRSRVNPRKSLGDAISYIRFGALTLKEFAQIVKPSKLLTAEEESDIFNFLVLGPDHDELVNMPNGFSNERRSRNRNNVEDSEHNLSSLSSTDGGLELRDEQEVNFHGNGQMSWHLASELTDNPLLFEVTSDALILGVKLWSYRDGETIENRYVEIVRVTLRDPNGVALASATFRDAVTFGGWIRVRFESPCAISANVIYSLNVNYTMPDALQWIESNFQLEYHTSLGLVLNLIEPVTSPICSITIA